MEGAHLDGEGFVGDSIGFEGAHLERVGFVGIGIQQNPLLPSELLRSDADADADADAEARIGWSLVLSGVLKGIPEQFA